MKQAGNTIRTPNLQEFLDSAGNAAKQGQRQFFTPPALSAALMTPLPRTRHLAADLQCGEGTLLKATGAEHLLGLDIDTRAARVVAGIENANAYTADTTRWYPLAVEAGFECPLFVLNPPFSLAWHADRLAHLANCKLAAVAKAFAHCPGSAKGTIDSTLATLLVALDRLTDNGEGIMLCNSDTARRFLGDPEGEGMDAPVATASLREHVWLWVDIPGLVFEGQATQFDTAVLYFAKSRQPGAAKYLRIGDSSDAAARLAGIDRWKIRFGGDTDTDYMWDQTPHRLEHWKAVREEYGRVHRGNKSKWNIWLDEHGRLRRHLDPFQKFSGRFNSDEVTRLNNLDGKSPMALVVQATTRTALRQAVECGIWRVDPAVSEAVAKALRDYESVRAPFYTPNPVKSLGWLDETTAIKAKRSGLDGIEPGKSYPLRTWIEDTHWEGKKVNLAGEKETLAYSGKELVVEVAAGSVLHHFHVRRDASLAETEERGYGDSASCVHHHHVTELVNIFDIPQPEDIATARAEEYNGRVLPLIEKIEARIRENIALA